MQSNTPLVWWTKKLSDIRSMVRLALGFVDYDKWMLGDFLSEGINDHP